MRVRASIAEVEAHPITNALLDASSIKDVGFSVSKEFWHGYSFYDNLAERIHGRFTQWLNVKKRLPRIEWDDATVDTAISLHDLLATGCGMQLEYYNGKAPPKPKRLAGQPRGTGASSSATGEQDEQVDGMAPVVLSYKSGARDLEQVWHYATPEAIVLDARQDARQRPSINKDKADYNTPFKMWLNVCLPEDFLNKLWGSDGWMNSRLNGKDNSAANRKTTIGEGIQFYGYMLAIANNPGWPVKSMWSEKLAPGEKLTMPPPAFGRFGMAENRFERLMHLHAFMHSISEDELDSEDPWQ